MCRQLILIKTGAAIFLFSVLAYSNSPMRVVEPSTPPVVPERLEKEWKSEASLNENQQKNLDIKKARILEIKEALRKKREEMQAAQGKQKSEIRNEIHQIMHSSKSEIESKRLGMHKQDEMNSETAKSIQEQYREEQKIRIQQMDEKRKLDEAKLRLYMEERRKQQLQWEAKRKLETQKLEELRKKIEDERRRQYEEQRKIEEERRRRD